MRSILDAAYPLIRCALTGQSSGPDVAAIIEALGHAETTHRLQAASDLLIMLKDKLNGMAQG